MVAVLDPTALTGFRRGLLSYSSQDENVYLITDDGAIPTVGVRVLTTLTDNLLTPIGNDWIERIGSTLSIVQPTSPRTVGSSVFDGRVAAVHHGQTNSFSIDLGTAKSGSVDAIPLATAPEAATFSQSAKSTFQVFCDDISLRLGGLQYSGLDTAGDGTAALAESPDTAHERDQVLKFASAGGEGAAWAAQDLRYQPHDAERDNFATTSLVSMASGFWKATLAVDGKAGHFFAGYNDRANQAAAEFQIGFSRFGTGWKVTVDGVRHGRALDQNTMTEIKVAWTATTLTVSSRKQGETAWTAEYEGTGLSIAAILSVRYGLWSPAYAAGAVYFSDVALAETFDDIDRDFYLAGSGTRDVSQTQANIALVIPDGLFSEMNQARLRWATGNDPSDGATTAWRPLLNKVQSVLPMSLTGLTHNTAYSYRFEIAKLDGTILYTSPAYRFRTLANAGTAQAAEIVVASCHGQQPFCHPYDGDSYVLDEATANYLGTLHVGDQGYEAGNLFLVYEGYPYLDPSESADDFEFQLRDWACDTVLVQLFERGMFFGTPDDHQFLDSFDATYKPGGSAASTLANSVGQSPNYGVGTTVSSLWTAGIAAFNAWFADHWIDKPSSGAFYKHWTHGKVEIILMDTRTERLATAGNYISATQMAWVKDKIDNIAATTSLVLFVAQGAFSTYTSKTGEGWERLADAQYEEFVDYCVANIDPAVNFAFINGDDHLGFNRHYIVKTAANPSMPVNFCGELRASGGAVGEATGIQSGHGEWWLPPADLPSANSFLRCSGAMLSISANADQVDVGMNVGGTEYTNVMLSSTPFTPAGVANLVEWWDASDNATAWSDTGATTPATAGSSDCAALTGKVAGTLLTGATAPPAYITDPTNGEKCLSFNPASPERMLYTGSIITDLFQGEIPFTLMIALKLAATGTNRTFLTIASQTGTSDQRHGFTVNASALAGSTRTPVPGTALTVNAASPAITTDWTVIAYMFTGTKMLMMVNDNLIDIADLDVADLTPVNRIVLGSRYLRSTNTFDQGWNGEIGEVFLINARWLSKDVLNLRDYLMAKWHN